LPVPEETTEIPTDVIQNNSDLSTDSDSDNDLQTSSSDPYENSGYNDLSLDSLDERETNDSQDKKTIFCQEYACIAILALISQ